MASSTELADRAATHAVAAGWLRFAATPTFALFALRAALVGGGSADFVCSARHGPALLDGMAAMYALMALLHAPPWIEVAARLGGRSMR